MRRGHAGRGTGGLLTILFTDIESSTAVTQRIGDARAQEIVRAHNQIVRREVAARGGSEVKHTGDGIMATFPSAARAVACAVAIEQASVRHTEAHPEAALRISVGLNAGEPVAEDADLFGAAIQLAARTCAEAKGGQILATDVVRQLVLGKGVLFSDAGLAEMKGFEQPVQLYEVSADAGSIDEGDTETVRLWRRPLVLGAGGIAIVLLVGGAVAAALAFSAGGSDGPAEPAYEAYEFSLETEFPVQVTEGDCITTDVVVRGADPGAQTTGDLSGTAVYSFEARLTAADGCRSLSSTEIADFNVAGGALHSESVGVSLQRLGNSPLVGSATEALSIGILLGTSGTYDGSVGKQTCRATGLTRATSGATTALARADCRATLTRSPEQAPMMINAGANAGEIATELSTSGKSDSVRVAAAFRNNTAAALTGVTLRLPAPRNATIATRLSADDEWVDGGRAFELPDVGAGEIASFEFAVRLLDTDLNRLVLVPEITAEGIEYVDRSDPIELTVVR